MNDSHIPYENIPYLKDDEAEEWAEYGLGFGPLFDAAGRPEALVLTAYDGEEASVTLYPEKVRILMTLCEAFVFPESVAAMRVRSGKLKASMEAGS